MCLQNLFCETVKLEFILDQPIIEDVTYESNATSEEECEKHLIDVGFILTPQELKREGKFLDCKFRVEVNHFDDKFLSQKKINKISKTLLSNPLNIAYCQNNNDLDECSADGKLEKAMENANLDVILQDLFSTIIPLADLELYEGKSGIIYPEESKYYWLNYNVVKIDEEHVDICMEIGGKKSLNLTGFINARFNRENAMIHDISISYKTTYLFLWWEESEEVTILFSSKEI